MTSRARGAGPAEIPEYVEAWRRYRFWARLRLLGFVGFVPIGIAAVQLSQWSGSPLPLLVVPAWILMTIVASVGSGSFRCPRCGGRFFSSTRWSNPLAKRCLRCGFPKWATVHPGDLPEPKRKPLRF